MVAGAKDPVLEGLVDLNPRMFLPSSSDVTTRSTSILGACLRLAVSSFWTIAKKKKRFPSRDSKGADRVPEDPVLEGLVDLDTRTFISRFRQASPSCQPASLERACDRGSFVARDDHKKKEKKTDIHLVAGKAQTECHVQRGTPPAWNASSLSIEVLPFRILLDLMALSWRHPGLVGGRKFQGNFLVSVWIKCQAQTSLPNRTAWLWPYMNLSLASILDRTSTLGRAAGSAAPAPGA